MMFHLPNRVFQDITVFAKKHDVEQVVLFGSRARETHTERSDVDIAVRGGDFDGFYWDIKENVDSLLMFDVVNLDEYISPELAEELSKEGVVIYEKMDNFLNCLNVLKQADFSLATENEIYRTGIIGQFNLTFELAWKALQQVLRVHGVQEAETGSPREILQLGYKVGFIEASSVWLLMLKKRNLSVHLYNEAEIDELLILIRDKFILAFGQLGKTLQQKLAEVEEN